MHLVYAAVLFCFIQTGSCLATSNPLEVQEERPAVPVYSIVDDYVPAQGQSGVLQKRDTTAVFRVVDNIPPAPDDNIKRVVPPKGKLVVNEDYCDKGKHIQLNAPVVRPPDPLVLWMAKGVLKGGYRLVDHTARIVLGCTANHLFNQVACITAGRAFYALTLYVTGGNVFISNFMYAFGAQTCQPIIASLVFYVGAHTPEIVYFMGTAVYKTVQLTSDAAILLFKGVELTEKGLKMFVGNKQKHDELIEMVRLNDPSLIDLTQKG